MIVWGGFYDGTFTEENGPLDTGARYDPQRDGWTLLPTNGAPSARLGHREMLIWGGNSRDGEFRAVNSGGRYDPESNSWQPVNTNGAPSPRTAHNAVWTGREMIVWGGGRGSETLGDGGRYDPATDTWALIATNGAPAARTIATAIWTGTEMIVWGGTTFHDSVSSWFGDGARYDPEKNVWSPVSNVNAPSPRVGHTAVWTGREMVVWGGLSHLGDGAKYDPAVDRWLPMRTAGAPFGRTYHAAVWTGSGMLVSGGSTPDGPPQFDFGLYNPGLPRLSIVASAANSTIQWQFPSTGFHLQQTSTLHPTKWVDVEADIGHQDAYWLFNVTATNTSFFRLKER